MINFLLNLFIIKNIYNIYTYTDNTIIRDFYDNNISNLVYYGKLSYYGADCYGCSGYVSYGTYVVNNIYYDDYQYGRVRIVAGDYSLLFGTIILIDNREKAIVLDRGSAIGFEKLALFDLLVESEEKSYEMGVKYNTRFEVLRNGF